MPSTAIGPIPGHLATPATPGPWPALIVVQEWWGLDQQTKNIADRFAGVGYLAFAPDLYEGELAQLGDGEKAMSLVQKYGPIAPPKLHAIYKALRQRLGCTGKVGSVGFCFGGRISLSLAILEPGLNAVRTFYGGGMQTLFDQLGSIHCPVLGLFGDQDQSIPVGTVEQFEQLLTRLNIPHEIKIYPKSGHAFFWDTDPKAYKPTAAADAWDRVTKFFKTNLN
ncbi:MAG: dienelactone hydrolase family protein [Chloroflexi bacterium]|nr:dienelactone hydrolase family protein [Chloroflexota bacterium]